jgi:hypothetical protein
MFTNKIFLKDWTLDIKELLLILSCLNDILITWAYALSFLEMLSEEFMYEMSWCL